MVNNPTWEIVCGAVPKFSRHHDPEYWVWKSSDGVYRTDKKQPVGEGGYATYEAAANVKGLTAVWACTFCGSFICGCDD